MKLVSERWKSRLNSVSSSFRLYLRVLSKSNSKYNCRTADIISILCVQIVWRLKGPHKEVCCHINRRRLCCGQWRCSCKVVSILWRLVSLAEISSLLPPCQSCEPQHLTPTWYSHTGLSSHVALTVALSSIAHNYILSDLTHRSGVLCLIVLVGVVFVFLRKAVMARVDMMKRESPQNIDTIWNWKEGKK